MHDTSRMLIASEMEIKREFYAAFLFLSPNDRDALQEICRERAVKHNLLVKELEYDDRYLITLPGLPHPPRA